MMNAIHHFAVIVKDLDKSLDFYHRVLGLEFLYEPTPIGSGEKLDKGIGIKGVSTRTACLQAGDVIIELMEYSSPDWPLSSPLPLYVTGSSHIAFKVDDIHATKKELEAKGVIFNSEVNVNDDLEEHSVLDGWSWVYFKDPDGYALELVHVARYDEDERKAGMEAYKKSRGWI